MVDNTIGTRVQAGTLEVTDSDIVGDDSTPRPSEWGIMMQWGLIETIGLTISGQERGGIEVTFPDNPIPQSGVKVELRESLIDGGERGIHGHGPGYALSLILSSTIVRNQTVAAISWALGQPSGVDISGDNQLSVLSGFALEDLRTDVSPFFPAIQAAGVTLNGNSYSGLVEGPASVAPDYRISRRRARFSSERAGEPRQDLIVVLDDLLGRQDPVARGGVRAGREHDAKAPGPRAADRRVDAAIGREAADHELLDATLGEEANVRLASTALKGFATELVMRLRISAGRRRRGSSARQCRRSRRRRGRAARRCPSPPDAR